MKLTYWTNFSKRKNSTKQPTSGTEIDVTLKDNTSLLNPTFQPGSVPANVNYCYVADFGRYYYVSGVSHDGPFCLIECECDVLATYKSQIGATNAYVEFTSSSTNTDITDPRNRPTYVTEDTSDSLFSLNAQNKPSFGLPGSYIVGLLTDDGVDYYSCSDATLQSLLNALYSSDFVQRVHNDFYDMKSCLVSCIKVPITYGTIDTTAVTPTIKGEIISADGVTPVSLRRIDTRVYTVSPGTKAISYPSDAWGLDFSYLDCAPYTTGNLFLPFVGVVALDEVFALNKAINISVAYDVCTGDIVYQLKKGDEIISTYQGNFAADVPVAGQSYNAIGAASSIVSAIGGVVGTAAGVAAGLGTSNPALAASAVVTGATALAGNGLGVLQSLQMHTQINGSLSSVCAWHMGHEVKYTVITRKPTESNIDSAFKASSGMPYFKGATISSLSGYVKCSGASVNMPGYAVEKDTVNAYLNNGFYYE